MKQNTFWSNTLLAFALAALLSTVFAPVVSQSYASSVTVAQKQVTLTDIQGHWAEKVITKLVAEKAIAGYPDGSYRPNKSITNAELASIIAGAVKLNPKEKTDHWASGIFAALYDKGIRPEDYPKSQWDTPISRYQMIKLLILVNENIQAHPGVDADDAKEAIADYASIPESYRYYVEQAVKKGFIRGDQNQRINGSSTTTRAEAAVIIDQLKTAKAGQTITPKPAPTPNPNPAPNPAPTPNPAPDQTGYAPKPAGYDQMDMTQKMNARKNKKIGWIYYDSKGSIDATKLTPLSKSDHQPSEEAYKMGLKMITLLNPGVDPNKWTNDNSHSLMTWDKAQQSFALTITKWTLDSESYSVKAFNNSNFNVESIGMLGSDGKGTVFSGRDFNALINPADRDDGSVSSQKYPVIKNNTDNPEYIILIGKFKGDSKNRIFIVPTKGLSGIIWDNDID